VKIPAKQFEIFSGTGGVGKTTLATSRAIHLARNGSKVLLITIDPAKRLKELLGIKDEDAGKTVTLTDPLKTGEEFTLDAQLMSPDVTIQRIASRSDTPDIATNRIMKILSKPYGGLNEILAIVELQMNYETQKYDCIVLDTPPGAHFLDFLESVDKISAFFDQSFIDIFNYLGKKVDTGAMGTGKKLMTMMVSTGVKKLLSYLEKVTGGGFVEDFMDAVAAIYGSKDSFLGALQLQQQLKSHEKANWYLVTSVDQNKVKEALELQAHAVDLLDKDTYVILNKCLQEKLTDWSPKEEDELAKRLKASFTHKEEELKKYMQSKFNHVLEFSEILKLSPLEHVKELSTQWNRFQ
jgi:anion-transporting  ArsA/GET3 family ATPase